MFGEQRGIGLFRHERLLCGSVPRTCQPAAGGRSSCHVLRETEKKSIEDNPIAGSLASLEAQHGTNEIVTTAGAQLSLVSSQCSGTEARRRASGFQSTSSSSRPRGQALR